MKIVKKILIIVVSLALLMFGVFILIVGYGFNRDLQTVWVTTAMTTMNHQWLATDFVPKETIERIMKENKVDDSKYNSTLQYKQDGVKKGGASYTSEGYREVEGDLYIKDVSGETFKGYLLLVPDPSRVQIVDTKYQGKKGQNVMTMVKENGAIAGVNGGGFNDGPNYDSNGGLVAGLLITEKDGLISPSVPDDINSFSMIGLNKNGSLVLRHATSKWALNNGIQSAISFEPYLIVDGVGTIKSGTGGWGIAPRSAIGQRATGEIIFLVIDGRQLGYSIGADLKSVQDILIQEKCVQAADLDGGSSTAMVIAEKSDYKYVNKPSLGHERFINNCFIIKYNHSGATQIKK